MERTAAEVAAYDAEELLTYAALTGDRKLHHEARVQLQAAAQGSADGPDAASRAALIEADPVSAATLGWLSYPDLTQVVTADPERFLYPDEAEAVRRRPADLRLIVLARTEGVTFGEMRLRPQHDYGLAARGATADVQRVWEMLSADGILGRESHPPSDS
ncbi:hypothetical protein [Modestobacter sp. Leaf380]|uniref:hypothetical protein n=1 Tax=Modestobacter sp. Leaf380 TaxID=1736356 RepID=UPI00070140ED|nr:hypothetical protein [Modestobacter sp. Leaf380]KQS67594.1 hypothetical protein ASG41_22665 [Modestobacter sp. Leaf380]